MNRQHSPSASVSASILADKKRGGSKLSSAADFAPIAVKLLIASCGCIGSSAAFLTCIDLGISASYAFWAFPMCLIFTFVFSLREKWLRRAGALVILALTVPVFINRYEICAGFANTLNCFLSTIREEYREKPFIELLEPELALSHTRTFIFFWEYIMCAFACHAAVRGNSASGVCCSTCIPVFSVLMFGLEPNLAAFFAVVVCWAAMFAVESNAAENISDSRCKKYSSHCGFYTAAISVLCIAAVFTASRMFGYERPEKLNIMYDEAVDYFSGGGVKQVIDDIVTIATRNIVPTGAINHGKLGEFDEISFDGKTVLEVTVPKSEDTVYLRGFVGSVYTGRSWEQLPDAKLKELEQITSSFDTEGLSPLLLDGYNLKYTSAEMPRHSFSVKNIAANTNYLYMPYNLVPESVSRYKINAGSGFSGSAKSYIGQFYEPKNYNGYRNIFRKKWSTPPALSADESAYRSFVYRNYLDLPESFSPDEIFGEHYYQYITAEESITGKSTLDEMTVLNRKIYFIKKWLRDNCEYSLSTGKLPAGKDFVDNFLETGEGSCSHFASAAIIMCRYAGIPARYAEGYIIKPKDFPTDISVGSSAVVDVTDLRGHAWAEIYLDGFGWYPVEFTSGYGNIRTAVPTETTVSEPETETETISESEEITESEYPDDQSEAVQEGTEQPSGEAEASQPQETTAVQDQNAETDVPGETAQTADVSDTASPEVKKPTVGFGVFGIKGGEQVDVLYDLTWLVIFAVMLVIIPAVFIIRRNAAAAKRRRTALRSAQAAAMDDYRRFEKLLKLMKMPEQGAMSCEDYVKTLSERSELLSDGSAEFIISRALKASFGGDSLTRSEANEMRLAVNSLAKRFCTRLSRFGKFRLKFIHCIL